MQLSPYTQYYIRKLLRQYLNNLHYPVSGVGIAAYFQESIYQQLQRLYPSSIELRAKLHELEMLVQHHQMSDVEKPYRTESLFDIEQKILWILNLKFLALLTSLSLTVLPESEASLFHFVQDNRVKEGIRCLEDLYGMVFAFGAEHDLKIYPLLLSLIGQQIPFVFAVSEHRHSIWVSLRSPFYYSLPKLLLPRLAKSSLHSAQVGAHLATGLLPSDRRLRKIA
ncbi:MAG: hypothetical protein ACKO7W_02665 [Elainella sp.]